MKKKNRLYQQMGLLNESDSTTASKKIFLSKQAKLLNSTINKTMGKDGSLFRVEDIFDFTFFLSMLSKTLTIFTL